MEIKVTEKIIKDKVTITLDKIELRTLRNIVGSYNLYMGMQLDEMKMRNSILNISMDDEVK